MGELLYKDLSYQIRGVAYAVKKKYGLGHKEVLYQRSFAEQLDGQKVRYEREKRIEVYSPDSGKIMCYYQPDFLVDNKIIVELKAKEIVSKSDIDRIYSYLKNSVYELGFFINYGSKDVEIKRIIYSNENKDWYKRGLTRTEARTNTDKKSA